MSGIPMISTSRHTYNKKVIASSEAFEANNDADADDLEALHMAKRKQPKAKPQPQPAIPAITEPAPQVVTRDIDPQPEQEVPGEPAGTEDEHPSTVPDAGPQSGQQARDKYNRRDMRAKR